MLEIIKATRENFEDVYKIDSQVEDYHIASNPKLLQKVDKQTKFKYWEPILEKEGEFILLAKKDNKPVGFCICSEKTRSPMFKIKRWVIIEAIGVDENYQSQGIGQKIYDYVEKYAKDNGYDALRLNVWEFNKGAQKFYKRLGFNFQSHNMEKIF
ncbi:MAG: GNAT family N-acetyltransferase [Alphaproteobacteria bacterium]|jgi:ribosomal protein S18 acetylase RimI-like enzyme|nr:GNAT family N-acetyltransferase [Alphaproteobacteria bacterium]